VSNREAAGRLFEDVINGRRLELLDEYGQLIIDVVLPGRKRHA
jgi:hypothetical protein